MLTINSKDMLNVGMYYENPDEDNKYDTDTSNNQLFATVDEAKEYCNNHIKENYVFNKETGYNENTKGCYYKLKRTDLSFNLSDNIVSVLVDPGSKTMSGTTFTINDYYKYGQKITLKVNYKNGYEYGSIVCKSGECTLNDDGTITLVSYADKVSIILQSKIIPPKYMIYHHYQDADDINGYSTEVGTSENVSMTNTDSTNYANVCGKQSNKNSTYTYNSSLSYLDSSKKEIDCYFDRNTYTVTFVKGNASAFDSHVSQINIVPASSIVLGLTSLTNNSTAIKYRHGQEIIINKSDFATDFQLDNVMCSDSNLCTIGKDGVTRVTVPTNNNLKVYVKSKPTEIEYKVYHHYQDADDINGYTADFVKTIGIVLSVGDDKNYNNECNQSKDGFTYNKTISYLDRSKKEINCYYDRNESVSVTFDSKDLNNIKTKSSLSNFALTLTPNTSKDVATTTINLSSPGTHTYRYGQEIVLTISGYVNVPGVEPVTCNSNNECIINTNGTFKTTLSNNLTFKPGTVEYKVYNHYQDADNVNGFTSELADPVTISMAVADDINRNNICAKQNNKGTHTFKKAISYLDSSRKEINCYFERN